MQSRASLLLILLSDQCSTGQLVQRQQTALSYTHDCLQADAALAEWCTDSALRRYLVARQWVLSNAAKMLQHTLEW